MKYRWIKFDLDGMIFKLKVYGFEAYNDWVKTSWRIKFEDIFLYERDNEEVFSKDCIDYLILNLKNHLDNKIRKVKTITFFEPDFEFVFRPQEKQYDGLTNEELEDIIDIRMEMNVYFWHRGATLNHTSTSFERKEIQKFYDYLFETRNKGRRKCKYTNFDK